MNIVVVDEVFCQNRLPDGMLESVATISGLSKGVSACSLVDGDH